MEAEFSFETLEPPAGVITADDGGAPGGPGDADAVLAALAAAEAEAAQAREAAHAEGLAAGREEALAALAPAAAALEAAASGVRDGQGALADRLESHAVDLALFLAERIVGGAIAARPELVLEAVRGALRGLVERERVTVLVHPDDLELVREAIDDVRGSLGGIGHCEVQAERRVARGGAILRTPDGDVDARVETKLARAREVVETALGRAPSTGA